MLLNGKLIFTSNMTIIESALQSSNSKVLLLDIYDESIYGQLYTRGVIPVSFLMPPYEAMSAAINADFNVYLNIYKSYLNDPQVMGNIARVLGILHQGLTAYIIIPPNVVDMGYHNVIIDHFRERFGIIAECIGNTFQYNINFEPMILDIMYLNDVILKEEFIAIERFDRMIPDDVVGKLFVEFRLTTQEQQIKFFEEMRNKGEHSTCQCGHDHAHGVVEHQQIVNAFAPIGGI